MVHSNVSWMRRALTLARRGQGFVHPNPMVGCIIVRAGKVTGKGCHRRFGEPHAEVEALRRAGEKARGATLYVNLEPCAHWGKTPPCVDAIVRSGIRHVVAAMRDPNPQVAGKGFARLRKQGIRVTQGLLEDDALELNRAFVTWMRERRPYVTLKAAMSLDGKIATVRGESQWITGPQARSQGHVLRAEADAVAVGIETVLKDDPSLTSHGKGRNPKRIVFDSRLRLPLTSKMTRQDAVTWVFTTSHAPMAKRKALERKGVSVFVVPKDSRGRISLSEAARVLAREGIAHLMVEGGGTLLASFLEAHLADEIVWFIAPKIIGGANAKTPVEGRGVARLAEAWPVRNIRVEQLGSNLCIRGKIKLARSRGREDARTLDVFSRRTRALAHSRTRV